MLKTAIRLHPLLFALCASFLFLALQGCLSSEDMREQLPEMEAELLTINEELGITPLEKMTVFPKGGASYVAFRYRPTDIKSFSESLILTASKLEYVVPEKDKVKDQADTLVFLCSKKSKYRSLRATRTEDGIVWITISADNIRRVFGSPLC